MKNMKIQSLVVACLLMMPLAAPAQVTVFNDDFSTGSTINATNPVSPTATSASYEEIASKSWDPSPATIASGHLKWGIASTSGGGDEVQALITTNPVTLKSPGDYVQLIVEFTVTPTNGILIADTQLGLGLFNANQVAPWGGGLNNRADNKSGHTEAATGGAQNWVGDIAQFAYASGSMHSQFSTRPAQSNGDNRNQVTEVNGSSIYGYQNPTYFNASDAPNVALTEGEQDAAVLTYTLLDDSTSVVMTARIYTHYPGGDVLTSETYTNATPSTTTFDAFSMGFRSKNNSSSTIIDLNSIEVISKVAGISESPDFLRLLTGQTNGSVQITIPLADTVGGPLSVDLVSGDPAVAYPAGASGGSFTVTFPQNSPYATTNLPVTVLGTGSALFYLTNATDDAYIQEGSNSCIISVVATSTSPSLPIIPSGVFNITSYGAVGDGVTTNTTAIQNAVNAALSAGGGTVELPAGVFLSGPFTLGSRMRFKLDAGATLLMLPYGSYPGGTNNPPAFIGANNVHDIELCGPGVLNGQGAPWWAADGGTLEESQRPYAVELNDCQRVFIHDWNSTNPPMKNIVFDGDDSDITVQNMTNTAPGSSPNTDGLNLQGNRCLVQNCVISVGDDNIAMGRSSGPGMNILITNITCGTGHGISIGSITSAGISNVMVVNCTFNGTQYGLRLKSDNDRGGLVQHITYANIELTNVDSPILLYSYYNEGHSLNVSAQTAASYGSDEVTSDTPIWRDITFSNITATSTHDGGIIWGRPEMLISNVTLDHVTIDSPHAFHVYNARGIRMVDTQITSSDGNTYELYNAVLALTNDMFGVPIFSTISATVLADSGSGSESESAISGSFKAVSPNAVSELSAAPNTKLGTDTKASILFPTITKANMKASSGVVISGSGGPKNHNYYLLGTTNLSLPLADWMLLATNTFDSLGNFSITNTTKLNSMFYRIEVQ